MTDVAARKLDRALARIGVLEGMIEDRTRDLFLANDRLSRVLETVDAALFVSDSSGRVETANAGASALLGRPSEELLGRHLPDLLGLESSEWERIGPGHSIRKAEVVVPSAALEEGIPVLLSASPLLDGDGSLEGVVCLAKDLRERRRLEVELRHAQKLESIGQLAAGIAHEINTPIQFVGDSAHFLKEAFEDLLPVVSAGQALRAGVQTGQAAETGAMAEKLDQAVEEADLEFLQEEVPGAVERIVDGVSRVSSIVSAMKEFSHPGGTQKAPVDVNRSIETTLTVARNEYKYVADVETDFGELPQVVCNQGDLNQAVLNLVVNAAHAIAALDREERGRIVVKTRPEANFAVIEVVDDGGGVPAPIRERIFDPFFTTKEPGKGTGQGLAIARNVIVEKHGGEIDLHVEAGVGSTFTIRLPIGVARE